MNFAPIPEILEDIRLGRMVTLKECLQIHLLHRRRKLSPAPAVRQSSETLSAPLSYRRWKRLDGW